MRHKTLKYIRNDAVSWYNTTRQKAMTLTYLLGRLTLWHETWSQKLNNFIFRSKADPFRWSVPASKGLPKNPSPPTLVSVHSIPSTQQPIHNSRRDVSIDLSDCTRVRTDRSYPSLKTKWCLPIPHRITHLSQSNDPETVPSSHAPVALPKLRKLHDELLLSIILRPEVPTKMIFDLDSTVLILYGKQEMARIGYNPQKWGRPSYHPLLCFNGITKDFLHGGLRPGDTHTATGTVELLKAVFAKLPPSVKSVIIRADKGFYDYETIKYLESNKALFVIVAKLTALVKRIISTLSYQVHSFGLETAEFMYQPTKWKKEYRFVVVRRLIPEDPTEQLTLFSMDKYSYQVIVTNMKLTPLHIWRFYNGRAALELIIKELKGDYPLGKIPTKHFPANEAYFHTLLFSYNLINWFERLCLPMEFHNMTLKTLGSRFLSIPSELIKSENRPILKLPPANFIYRDIFEYAIKKIENLKT